MPAVLPVPALTDEVTERHLHFVFRCFLWNLDQFSHFFYTFFLETNRRGRGMRAEGDTVVETPIGIPSDTIFCWFLCFTNEGRFPSFSCAWTGKCCCIPTSKLAFHWNQSKCKPSLALLKLIVSIPDHFLTGNHLFRVYPGEKLMSGNI